MNIDVFRKLANSSEQHVCALDIRIELVDNFWQQSQLASIIALSLVEVISDNAVCACVTCVEVSISVHLT